MMINRTLLTILAVLLLAASAAAQTSMSLMSPRINPEDPDPTVRYRVLFDTRGREGIIEGEPDTIIVAEAKEEPDLYSNASWFINIDPFGDQNSILDTFSPGKIVTINALKLPWESWRVPFVANLTNLFNDADDDSIQARYNSIVSSDEGILFGLMPTKHLTTWHAFDIGLNLTALGKLNRVAKGNETDETSAIFTGRYGLGLTLDMPSDRTTRPIQLTVNGYKMVVASKSEYEDIFGEKPDSPTVFEASLMVPYNAENGLIIGMSTLKGSSPGWRFGYVHYGN